MNWKLLMCVYNVAISRCHAIQRCPKSSAWHSVYRLKLVPMFMSVLLISLLRNDWWHIIWYTTITVLWYSIMVIIITLSIRLSQCYSSSSHLRPDLITPLHFVCQNRREYAVWIPLYYLLIFLVGLSSCKNLCQSHHSNVVFSMFVNFISEQFWFISQFCWLKYIDCLVITTYFCWLTPQNQNQVDPRISGLATYWQCSAIYWKYNLYIYIYCIYWKKHGFNMIEPH